jgi:hypothetical protein
VKTRPALALALALAAGAVAGTWPLAREWRGALPVMIPPGPPERHVLTRAPGDTLQLYYQLWLARDGVVGPTPAFTDPYQFRTDGPRPNGPQTFPPLALPFLLLSAAGPTGAYNLLVLLSFPLAGLAAYRLVRDATGDAGAGAVAGAAYALAPARVGPLIGGQPAGFAFALAPLALWGLDRALLEGRRGPALAGGAALAAVAMLEPHHAYILGGGLLLYAPLRWLAAGRPGQGGAALAAFALAAAPGAGWLLWLRQAFLVGSIADAGRRLDEVRLFSTGPGPLLDPALYGGPVGLLLAVAGLGALGRPATRALAALHAAALAAGLVLGAGPTLPGLPLYETLHRHLPLFGFIRNPGKFHLLSALGASVLAGLGARALRVRLPGRLAGAAAPLLVAALLVTLLPRHGVVLTRVPDGPVHEALRAGASRVLYVPVWPGDSAWSSPYLHDATRTRVAMLNGYSPLVPRRYVGDVFEPLQGLNVGDLDAGAHAALRRLGVSHVVLDRSLFPPDASSLPTAFTLAGLRASPALRLERADDPLWLFRVTDRAPAPPGGRTSPVGVFHEAEKLPRLTGRVVADPAASNGQAAAAWPGEPAGFLAFGPHDLLPAGRYRVTFRTAGPGLRLEVTTDLGRRVLAAGPALPGPGWTLTTLDVALERARRVEFRVRWDGRAAVAADWVLTVFADRPQPEWAFEVEDLPHRLGERPDPAASGGWAGYAGAGVSERAELVAGPARLYPAGRYRVILRARAEGPAGGTLLHLEASDPAGRILVRRPVDAAELPPGGYREVALDVDLPGPEVLEFPVGYYGGTGVYFDRVEIRPRDTAGPSPGAR